MSFPNRIVHARMQVSRPPVYVDLIWFSRGQSVQVSIQHACTMTLLKKLQRVLMFLTIGGKQDKVAATVTEAVKRALKVWTEGEGRRGDASCGSGVDRFPSPLCSYANQAGTKEGEEVADVTVIARALEKHDYYENGSHF